MTIRDLYPAFETITGNQVVAIEEIKGSGSNRHYFRLKSISDSLIGVIGESQEENIAFVELCKHFSDKNLPVPQVLYFSNDKISYLQQDLGDTSLFEYMRSGREKGNFSNEVKQLLQDTLGILIKFQYEGGKNMDFSVCYPVAEFDRHSVFWDLNYFKYYFLKPSGIPFSEKKLEEDFEKMATILLSSPSETFLYRDFQSRNVMIHNKKPYFIDFQGGRKGPIFYDLASFLWQAKANFPEELKEELLTFYFNELKKYDSISKEEFRNQLKQFVLFRTLQVLGAYGYRGYFEKKTHFLESIPFALHNLYTLLQKEEFEYTYLIPLLKQLYLILRMKNNSHI